jgi:antitoxin MazE6
MKTAVSIPQDVFDRAERLARRTKKPRSKVFTEALREYVWRHDTDEVTEAMNRVCDGLAEKRDSFVSAAGRRTLERSEW